MRIFKYFIRHFSSKFVRKYSRRRFWNQKRKKNFKSQLWKQNELSSLKNFEIHKYYQNEPRFNGAYSRNNLPNKIKDGAWVRNLDESVDVCIYQIALFCKRNEIVYFDSFYFEHVPEEIKEFVGSKDIIAKHFSSTSK